MRVSMLGLAMATIALLGPSWALASEPTAEAIASAMKASGQFSDYSIGVRYQDGVALLSGRVASDEQLRLALEMASAQPGVERVLNDLEVRSSQTDEAEGSAAALRVATRAAGDESAVESEVELTAHQIRRENLPHPARAFRAPAGRPTPAAPAPAVQRPQVSQVMDSRSLGEPVDPLAQMQEPNFTASTSQRFSNSQARPVTQVSTAPAAANRPAANNAPLKMASVPAEYAGHHGRARAAAGPAYTPAMGGPVAPAAYDAPHMPNHAWPAYAAYPNYAAVSYPQQYSPSAWPYIGPFYPYPQVPLGWRKVTLEWDDGWWFLDFADKHRHWRR